jgi:hypothetical protein
MTLLTTLTGAATEIAPSTPVLKDGPFEIRDYPALVLAETSKGAKDDNGSFGRLFRYISGANEADQKIPMTAPVFMDGRGNEGKMSFVMPATMTVDTTPKARGNDVTVRSERPGRFAVHRFGGFANAANERAAVAELERWMKERSLTAEGSPFFAYYDPPWTLPPFRRNEVMIRLKDREPDR